MLKILAAPSKKTFAVSIGHCTKGDLAALHDVSDERGASVCTRAFYETGGQIETENAAYDFAANCLLSDKGNNSDVLKGTMTHKGEKAMPIAAKWCGKPGQDNNDYQESGADEVAWYQAIGSHPNVMRLLDVVAVKGTESGAQLFLIFPLVEGGDLESYVQRNRTESEANNLNGQHAEAACQKIFYGLTNAVAFLHSKNIVHCDIKARNVLLEANGNPLLSDMGTALSTQELTEVIMLGTPGYIAPEIVYGRKKTETVDVWSLGVLMYEMYFGEFPFPCSNNPFTTLRNGIAFYSKGCPGILAAEDGQALKAPLFGVSNEAELRDLLSKMLTGTEKRLAAKDICQHPFFKKPK